MTSKKKAPSRKVTSRKATIKTACSIAINGVATLSFYQAVEQERGRRLDKADEKHLAQAKKEAAIACGCKR